MIKVLVLCTGNSCRSIIAEALINANLDGFVAKSAGVVPKDEVNPLAKKILKEKGIWDERYHPKDIGDVLDEDFDLVITVCDNAKKSCPIFPKKTKKLHIPFDDPDGKDFSAFEKTYNNIKDILLPKVLDAFSS